MDLNTSFPQLNINLVRLTKEFTPEQYTAIEGVFRTLVRTIEDMHVVTAQVVNANAAVLKNTAAIPSFADDAAAAAGGVELYSYYRTGSVVKQRVA